MLEVAKKTILFGIGALSFTKEKGEKMVKELVEKGKWSQEEATALVAGIMIKGTEEKEALAKILNEELDQARQNLGLVTREELEALKARVERLEQTLIK